MMIDYVKESLSFEEWLNNKYSNAEWVNDAKRSLNVRTAERTSHFDSANNIAVEELFI